MSDARDYLERRWWALALLCMTQFMVVLDASIVNIALPTIGREVGISQENLSWVVNAYVLTFGGFLLLGGRMADLLGRRRIFMAGLVIVAVASLFAGFAPNEGVLIAARAGAGARSGDHRAERALDRHDDLPGRLRAKQGAGRLGRGGRLRRRRGSAAGRCPHRRARLGVGPVGERARRARGAGAHSGADPREPLGVADAHLRHCRRGDCHGRALAAGLRDRRCRERRVGFHEDDRAARRRRSRCWASSR